LVEWLLTQGAGPAAVAMPVTWTASRMGAAARRWVNSVLDQGEDTLRALSATPGGSRLTKSELVALTALLSDDATWRRVAGENTDYLEDLVAACFPPTDSRSPDESKHLASAVVMNLVGFQLSELDDDMFREYLAGLLERLHGQSLTHIDETFLKIHDDIVTGHAQTRRYFGKLFAFLRDRLPPGPAGARVLRIYLIGMIDYLDDDPWPTREEAAASAPRPSDIERKLTVRDDTPTRAPETAADGDTVADRSNRLVVLGGPGSGKTWFAKRTARRSAQTALDRLNHGVPVEGIEIPIYATCQHFFAEGDGVRRAVFAAAKRSLPDLGCARFTDAIGTLIDDHRHALVVLDSLDEASVVNARRLGSVATVEGWRIFITSRPSSWNQQLKIDPADERHAVAELQELSYPKDVVAMIDGWLKPSAAERLKQHLAQQPGRAQLARVPLICALYCIVGEAGVLPETRRDLYRKASAKLLHAQWRDEEHGYVDVEDAEKQLRSWAAIGLNETNVDTGSVSETIVATGTAPSAADHICPRVQRIDDGRVHERRFVHHTFREHFAAEHVALLPIDEAEQILRPHLWFDPKWATVVPAAIGAHPNGADLAARLLVPSDIYPDTSDQLSRHLAALATETRPQGWASIGPAMLDARRRLIGTRNERPSGWPDHDRQVGAHAIDCMNSDSASPELTSLLFALGGPEFRQAILDHLIALLASESDGRTASKSARQLAKLGLSAEQSAMATSTFLKWLAFETDGRVAVELAAAASELGLSEEQREVAMSALLELLGPIADGRMANVVAGGLMMLGPSEVQRTTVMSRLLELLIAETDGISAANLAEGVVRVGPTEVQRELATNALLRLDSNADNWMPSRVAYAMALLGPSEHQRSVAMNQFLALLAAETDLEVVRDLLEGVVELRPSEEQRKAATLRLSELLACETRGISGADLVQVMVPLGPSADQRETAMSRLQDLLEAETDGMGARWLVEGIMELGPSTRQREIALIRLMRLLGSESSGWGVQWLIEGVMQLGPSETQRELALHRVIDFLQVETQGQTATELARGVARLGPSESQRVVALTRLLEILYNETYGPVTTGLMRAAIELNPTSSDMLAIGRIPQQHSHRILAATRQNSDWESWVLDLPTLHSCVASSDAAT
jgi:hypothetical protein